jgi:mannan endo-1,4-beta-mannosidase
VGPSPTQYANHFFRLEEAMALFDDYIRQLVGRRNSFTGVPYASDPTIFAWEIANEPRGGRAVIPEYGVWVRRVAKLLKALDSNHLVTVGSEGTGGGGPFRLDFDAAEIDCADLGTRILALGRAGRACQ